MAGLKRLASLSEDFEPFHFSFVPGSLIVLKNYWIFEIHDFEKLQSYMKLCMVYICFGMKIQTFS